ncbi:MAG: hypothetical protein AB1346_03590 [Thermodesulfobacteriota bacterium]
MEAILIEMESLAPLGVSLAGLVPLALVAAAAFIGYTAEEERSGRRLFWAEWPLPGTEEKTTETRLEEREHLEAA